MHYTNKWKTKVGCCLCLVNYILNETDLPVAIISGIHPKSIAESWKLLMNIMGGELKVFKPFPPVTDELGGGRSIQALGASSGDTVHFIWHILIEKGFNMMA